MKNNGTNHTGTHGGNRNLYSASVKITCLGHGNAFATQEIGNSSYLLEWQDQRILLDCGSTIPETLTELNIDPGSLTGIVVSHLHADHVGGLERLLYQRRFLRGAKYVPLVMGHYTQLDWANSVNMLRTLDIGDSSPYVALGPLGKLPMSYSEQGGGKIVGIFGGSSQGAAGSTIKAFQTDHGGECSVMSCYSFLIEIPAGPKIFFSGDRVWRHDSDDDIFNAMASADLVLHELDLGSIPSGVHTHCTEIPDSVRMDPRYFWHHHNTQPWMSARELRLHRDFQLIFKYDTINL